MAVRSLHPLLQTLLLLILTASALASDVRLLEDYQRYHDSGELVILGQGEQTFPALQLDRLTGQGKGIAVLLPDWGRTMTNPDGIGYLRQRMTEFGWNTLAITPPTLVLPQNHISPKTEVTPEKQEQSAPEPLKPRHVEEWFAKNRKQAEMTAYLAQLKYRMERAAEHAQGSPGFFLVIAQGSSAAMLLKLYSDESLPLPDALVTLSAYFPDHELNTELASLMGRAGTPVLDLYSHYDNRWVTDTVMLRRQMAKKFFKLHYRQRELFGNSYLSDHNPLIWREVYGWLTSLGW